MAHDPDITRMDISADGNETRSKRPPLREVVAIFDGPEEMQEAVDALQSQGFNRADLSTLAGPVARNVEQIADDPTAPRTVPVSRSSLGDAEGVLIGGGVYLFVVAGAIAFAAAGASLTSMVVVVALLGVLGGLFGWLLARWLDRRYDSAVRDQMAHGGMVLWVHTTSPDQEARAGEILRAHHGRKVHAHEFA